MSKVMSYTNMQDQLHKNPKQEIDNTDVIHAIKDFGRPLKRVSKWTLKYKSRLNTYLMINANRGRSR
jgi:hypothetical protein